MILKEWGGKKEVSLYDDLSVSGIIDAKRFMYIFFSENDIETYKLGHEVLSNTLVGKAIQVNMSVSTIDKNTIDIDPMLKGPNSVSVQYYVYLYDIISHNCNLGDPHNMEFILSGSFTNVHVNDFNINKTFDHNYNFYSADLRNDHEKRSIIENNMNIMAPRIPEPKYYSMNHQFITDGEDYDISALSHMLVYQGHELVDEHTKVYLTNLSLWDSMLPEIKETMYNVRYKTQGYENLVDLSELSDMLLYRTVISNQIHGAVYIVDSELGNNVVNTQNTFVPFRKYENDNFLRNSIATTIDFISRYAENLSNKHGSVRLMVSPLYTGDKMKIHFRDYSDNNQPIIKNKQNIDTGSSVVNEINDLLLLGESDSEYPTNGYKEDY